MVLIFAFRNQKLLGWEKLPRRNEINLAKNKKNFIQWQRTSRSLWFVSLYSETETGEIERSGSK